MKKINAVLPCLFMMLAIVCTQVAGAQVLTIQPFTLYTNDGAKVIELEKDGLIHIFEQPVGRLFNNGQVRDTTGALLASLDKDGLLKDGDQKTLGKLLADGSWDNGSGTLLHFNNNGIYSIHDDLSLRLEPNDKNVYKSANLLVTLTFYITTVKGNPEGEVISDPDIVLVLSKSPGGPGSQSYEYTVHADGKVSPAGYTHATTPYHITQEQLTTLLNAAKDIDMAALASNAKPLPFVHDGQVTTLKLKDNTTLYAIYFGPGGDPMTREIEVYINYVRRFLANTLKRK